MRIRGARNEARERAEAALRREVYEELSLPIGSVDPRADVTHEYDFGTVRVNPFLAYCVERSCNHLTELAAFAWVILEAGERQQCAPAHISILSTLRRLARL